MNCKETARKLNAYVDGELPGEQAARIEAHLEACAHCAREREELLRLNRALDVMPGMAGPVGFNARLRALAVERIKGRSKLVRIAPLVRFRLPTAVAATLLLAAGLLIGGFMGSSISAAQASRQSVAQAYESEFGPLEAVPPTSVAAAYLQAAAEIQ